MVLYKRSKRYIATWWGNPTARRMLSRLHGRALGTALDGNSYCHLQIGMGADTRCWSSGAKWLEEIHYSRFSMTMAIPFPRIRIRGLNYVDQSSPQTRSRVSGSRDGANSYRNWDPTKRSSSR